MRMELRNVAVMVAVTIIAAACGDGTGGTPVETPVGTPAETPLLTPEPTAAPSPTAIIEPPMCDAAALRLTLRALPGSDLDAGWTGIAHNSAWTDGEVVTTNLNCTDGIAAVDGSDLVGQPFGSPLPVSGGGMSVCVLNSFREAMTGTYENDAGCSEFSVKLRSRFVLVPNAVDAPCPPCVGDPTPSDGSKGGTCRGGTTPGAACDAGGTSDLFQNATGAASDSGTTSNDCLPTGDDVGALDLDVDPLTTKTVTVAANLDCQSGASPPGSCYCPGQVQPNACQPDGVCPASGVCELGPIDGVCEGQPFRPCRSGTGTEDCDAVFPGAGSCVDRPRPCFGNEITRTGSCGTQTSTLVSFVCIPATNSAAVNTTFGLPGPAAITLPVRQTFRPR